MDHLVAHGIVTREREAVWIERKRRYARGEIDHNQLALEANGEYARALAGWSLQQAAPLVQQFVAETDHRRVYGWVAPLLRCLTTAGVRAVVISGAAQEILVEHVQHLELAGVEVHGLTLEVGSGGRFTGEVAANIGTDADKRALIDHLAATGGPIRLGVGDSISDLPLLQAARRQLVLGRHAPALLDALGVTATCIPDPETATAQEVVDLVRSLVNS